MENPGPTAAVRVPSVALADPPRAANAAAPRPRAKMTTRSDQRIPGTTGRAADRIASSLLRLRHDSDVRPRLLPFAEDFLRLVVRHRPRDDHIAALLPLRRGRDAVLRRQLERVDHAQHLVEVAARRHRVDEDQLDLLVRAD